MKGFNEDGGNYVFTAKTAQQDILKPNLIELNGIVGEVYQADKTRTDITAARGLFQNDTGVLQLYDQINVDSQTGLKARLIEAKIETKKDLLTSTKPVLVEFPNGSVKSQRLTLRQKAREATFAGSVLAELTPPPDEKKEKPAVATGDAATSAMFTPCERTDHHRVRTARSQRRQQESRLRRRRARAPGRRKPDEPRT